MSCIGCQMQGKPVNNLISREIPALVEKGRCLVSATIVNHTVIIKLHNYKGYFLSCLKVLDMIKSISVSIRRKKNQNTCFLQSVFETKGKLHWEKDCSNRTCCVKFSRLIET